jgi:hypothetical protein
MSIRIIIRTDSAAMAANVGGAVEVQYRTFLVELSEIESFLREPMEKNWAFTARQVVGIELEPA